MTTDKQELPYYQDGPEGIFLQPRCCASDSEGRLWCEHDAPEDCEDERPWTPYIRADLNAAVIRERDQLLAELAAVTAERDALREALTQQQEAEPVAWLCKSKDGQVDAATTTHQKDTYARVGREILPVYLHPSKPAAQPQVPEGMLRVELAMSDRSISRLIPVVQIETSSANEVERYANQCWRELSAAKEEGK